MNPEDLVAMAKAIYMQLLFQQPLNWDKQKMARDSIEWAKQFALALQSEKEGSVFQTGSMPQMGQRQELPTGHTGQWMTQSLAEQSQGSHTTPSNQMAAGRGKVTQRHSGQGMG